MYINDYLCNSPDDRDEVEALSSPLTLLPFNPFSVRLDIDLDNDEEFTFSCGLKLIPVVADDGNLLLRGIVL